MESQVVQCGNSAQTNGCPIPGANGPTLNKVDPLAAPFAATPSQSPAPPMSRSHGLSASVIVAIIALVILATAVALLFRWDYRKRGRAQREMHGGGAHQTVVVQLGSYNGRLEHRRVTPLAGPDAQPSVQRGDPRADSVAYFLNGLEMPRRPEAAARAPIVGGLRVAEDQVLSRASEENARTLVASIGDIRSVTSDMTLRNTEAGDDSSEIEGETSTFGPRRVPSLDDIAEYRSWRSAE